MNLTVIEEWIEEMGLPIGIQTHFGAVRDLLNWLQVCVTFLMVLPCADCL